MKPKVTGGGDDLAKAMASLSIDSAYSMDFVCPFIMYRHARGERDFVTCEFYVPTLDQDQFRVVVPVSNRRKLQIGVTVPNLFGEKDRQEKVYRRDRAFNQNTHENTAYKKIAEKIQSDFDDGSNRTLLIGKLQEVDLPFECEEDIRWDICLHRNTDFEGHNIQLLHSILKVHLKSVVKPKTKHRARVRLVLDDDEGDRDGDSDENAEGGGGEGGKGVGGGDEDEEEMDENDL